MKDGGSGGRMTEDVRPRVLFSRCLGFDHCRYNGNVIVESVVEHLKPFVEAITVCPEMAIGLGVPRDPIRVIRRGEGPRLLQPQTGADVTEKMNAFVAPYLESLGDVHGFVLKAASPSCGPRDVKVYVNEKPGAAFEKGAGMLGGAVVERFPHCAIEDEGRMRNFDIRQHFLTRLFTLARLRSAQACGRIRDLVAFHARHKFLLMAYNQSELRVLGRIVASRGRRPMDAVWIDYGDHLDVALRRLPRRTSAINVLMHGLGYISEHLTAREKTYFLDTLEQYRNRHVPLSVPTSVLRSWIVRFEESYLKDQVYFEPYPRDLIEVLDSGKGRRL
jgi:uncharacterized protein YbgA (DUF1722 family)/uncharacterized protein YbbK (DUF523 family)